MGMRLSPFLSLLTVALLATLSGQAVVINPSTDFEGPVSTDGGGRSLLVHEITATHCSTCAEIDPELIQVADSHGSRIALIALHPTDSMDAFQPEAAHYRIQRLNSTQPGVSSSTPTFVVEDGTARRGYDAWGEVQRDILNQEMKRQNVSEVDIMVTKTDTGYRASIAHTDLVQATGAQLTMMVVQHGKPMPEGAVNPGGDHRDRVLVGLAECALDNNTITARFGLRNASVGDSCESSLSVEFDEMDSWSVVLVHEATQESLDAGGSLTSYGAVELAFRERSEDQASGSVIGTVLLWGCVLLAFSSIVRKK